MLLKTMLLETIKAVLSRNPFKIHNYMTVPAAIKELEKIQAIKLIDGVYKLDHAVTATQKSILKAFGMDEKYVKNKIQELGKLLNAAA